MNLLKLPYKQNKYTLYIFFSLLFLVLSVIIVFYRSVSNNPEINRVDPCGEGEKMVTELECSYVPSVSCRQVQKCVKDSPPKPNPTPDDAGVDDRDDTPIGGKPTNNRECTPGETDSKSGAKCSSNTSNTEWKRTCGNDGKWNYWKKDDSNCDDLAGVNEGNISENPNFDLHFDLFVNHQGFGECSPEGSTSRTPKKCPDGEIGNAWFSQICIGGKWFYQTYDASNCVEFGGEAFEQNCTSLSTAESTCRLSLSGGACICDHRRYIEGTRRRPIDENYTVVERPEPPVRDIVELEIKGVSCGSGDSWSNSYEVRCPFGSGKAKNINRCNNGKLYTNSDVSGCVPKVGCSVGSTDPSCYLNDIPLKASSTTNSLIDILNNESTVVEILDNEPISFSSDKVLGLNSYYFKPVSAQESLPNISDFLFGYNLGIKDNYISGWLCSMNTSDVPVGVEIYASNFYNPPCFTKQGIQYCKVGVAEKSGKPSSLTKPSFCKSDMYFYNEVLSPALYDGYMHDLHLVVRTEYGLDFTLPNYEGAFESFQSTFSTSSKMSEYFINRNWQGPITSLTMPDGTTGLPSAQAEVYFGQIPNTNQGVILQTVFMQANNKAYNRWGKVSLLTGATTWGTFSTPTDLSAYAIPSVPTNGTVNAYGLTLVPPNNFLTTIFVNNVGYSRLGTFNINADGTVYLTYGGNSWQQISLNNAPGTGTIQAYDLAYYSNDGGFFLETYAKNNNFYYRFLRPTSNISNVINKSGATGWYGPLLINTLPGEGDLITYSYYVLNDKDVLSQAYWKSSSGGYFRMLRPTQMSWPKDPAPTPTPTPTPLIPTPTPQVPTPTPTPSIPTPNRPPVINSISFSSNNNYVDPSDVTVSVSASDPDGTVSSVEFYNYNSLLHTDNTPPFTYTWGGRVQGGHLIKVRAKDNNGTYSAYSTKGFTVNSTLTPTPNIISLDVNNDKKQDILDVITAIKVVFNNQPSSNSVDVNGDGKKDILDVIKIIQAVFSGSPS